MIMLFDIIKIVFCFNSDWFVAIWLSEVTSQWLPHFIKYMHTYEAGYNDDFEKQNCSMVELAVEWIKIVLLRM